MSSVVGPVEPAPVYNDAITLVGNRIEYVADQELRDLIWDLAEDVFNMGVSVGKSYARHQIAFDEQVAQAVKVEEAAQEDGLDQEPASEE